MKNTNNTAPLSFLEKIGYGAGDMASQFYMGFFNIFLLYYYVDVWGISPTGVATMFLVTKVIDAISDPTMGIISDRTETKWGKYRPFLLWVVIPYAALGYLLFLGPDLSQSGKLIFAYISYSLIMLGYTAINVPYSALLAVIHPLSEERTKATQYRFVLASVGTILVGATAKPLVDSLGGGDEVLGFRLTILIFAVLTILLFFFTFFTTKERIRPKKHESSIKEDLNVLRKNISWIILAICSILIVVGLVARISSTAFFTKYNMELGAEKVLWWMDSTTLIITFGFVGQLFGALITPSLLKIVDKRRLMIASNLLFASSILATYFVPTHQFVGTLLLYSLGIFAFGIIITLLFAMYTDCAEYGEWMSGHNSAGLTVSASMFALKFGSAVGSAIPGYILGWYGFVKNQVQTEEALTGIGTMWNFVPALFFLAAALLMVFYKLDGNTMQKVERELLERRGEIV
ncbi:MAG: MFS transporter [Saprospiraceae bacterium]|nr:MFS transporter [Bacteroidia bacterium]NNE13789.1 MFS transporter [Saprospiraceae bacterium]NNL90925.1 MFS transporter [Saprospiraceae bacterium]